jgi:uncharacterized protein (DUF1499 family)
MSQRVFAGLLTPFRQLLSGRGLPSIHDITTDPDDPPQFSAVLARRTGNVSPPEYDGVHAANEQRRAYPDIVPLDLGVAAERALDEAAAVARQLGWEVVGVDRTRGQLEAIDTTFWFRFKDDIVVRVRAIEESVSPVASGFSRTISRSRVDVRSKSRVGRGDLGANARRIRMFTAALLARLSGQP